MTTSEMQCISVGDVIGEVNLKQRTTFFFRQQNQSDPATQLQPRLERHWARDIIPWKIEKT